MRTKKKQLKENIKYCIDVLELEDNSIGEVLRASEKLGVSCEYFVEEFVVLDDSEAEQSIHDDDYLTMPDLTEEEVNSISESIFKEYDYSKIYDTIEGYIIQFAEDNDLTYEVEEIDNEGVEFDQPEYK